MLNLKELVSVALGGTKLKEAESNAKIVDLVNHTLEVIRPSAPPDVSVYKGIMSCFSFLFVGVVRHYAKSPFICWCKASSFV